MEVDLEGALEAVFDEETFLLFLAALAADRADEARKEKLEPSPPYSSGANGWQHSSIEAFLEAAAAWGESSKDGLPSVYEKPANPWKRCADILYMGKHYE